MGKGWIPAEGKLDLEDEGRTEWPAAEIAAAGPENIRVLDLDGNKLTAIPGEQLARLTALEKLRLYNNQLTAIPAELARLSALEVLNVCNNQLTAIPAEVGRLSALQLLDVSSNRLTAIPAEVGHLPLLTSFYAMGNPLTDLPASARVSNGAVLAYLRSLPPPAAAAVSAPASAPASPGALPADEEEEEEEEEEPHPRKKRAAESGLRMRAEASESEAAGLRRQLQAREAEVASLRQELAGAVQLSEAHLRALPAAQLDALAARLGEASQRVTELRIEARLRVCCVCMERPVGVTLQPCGHTKLCVECAQRLLDGTRQCPECRQAIAQLIRAFT